MERRDFVLSSLLTFGTGLSVKDIELPKKKDSLLRFGVVTDIHYAVKKPAINRYYEEAFYKLRECVDLMNQEEVDFLIELGDFKDQGAEPKEKETLKFLEDIEAEFRKFRGPTYHVLGNHDMDSISKDQFLNRITNTGFSKAQNYYSFNRKGFHFVVLDANYSKEGVSYDHGNVSWKDSYVPEKQLEWLKEDLRRNAKPTIVFVHQQLDDISFDEEHRVFCPYNSKEVREIIEHSNQVLIVFQGHFHEGSFNKIQQVYYYTLKAVIEGSGKENNSYIIVEINSDLKMNIKGYRKAESKDALS